MSNTYVDATANAPCWVMAEDRFINAAGENCLRYDNRVYSLPVGKMVMVPREFINNWLGNPDARDHPTDRDLRHRTAELTRVARKWGNEVGAQARFPRIHAWDFEQNLLPTIVEDPRGTTVAAPDPNEVSQGQLQAMQQQLAKAFAAMRQMAAENDIELDDLDLTPRPPVPQPMNPMATAQMAPPAPPVAVDAPLFEPAAAPQGAALKEPDGPAWAVGGDVGVGVETAEPVAPAEPTIAPPPSIDSLPEAPDPTTAKPAKKAPSRPKVATPK